MDRMITTSQYEQRARAQRRAKIRRIAGAVIFWPLAAALMTAMASLGGWPF